MSLFQIVLLIISVVVLYIFFKQLFSGSYPKRGIDFEAKSQMSILELLHPLIKI